MSCSWEEKKIRKDRLEKRKINIESEFIGAVPLHKKKKEKKNDCTEEIKKFLSEPITLDTIQSILWRIYCNHIQNINTKMKILSIKKYNHINEKHSRYDFMIYIYAPKSNIYFEFFLSTWNFLDIHCFIIDKLDTSPLKKDLSISICNWLENNLDKTIEIEIK